MTAILLTSSCHHRPLLSDVPRLVDRDPSDRLSPDIRGLCCRPVPLRGFGACTLASHLALDLFGIAASGVERRVKKLFGRWLWLRRGLLWTGYMIALAGCCGCCSSRWRGCSPGQWRSGAGDGSRLSCVRRREGTFATWVRGGFGQAWSGDAVASSGSHSWMGSPTG